MPRLPFNNLCDIYKGPGTLTPGLLVGTFPCRFVVEDGIHSIGTGCPVIAAYLTIEGYLPQGAWTSPFFGMDASLCDRIAIPSGQADRFFVLYSDVIIWNAQPSYYRAYLVYLPPPAPGPSGGILFGGSAIVYFHAGIIGEGGILWGGDADVYFHAGIIGEGGILWGGDADSSVTRMRFVEGDGGILFGGSATATFTPGTTYYWDDTFTDSNGVSLGSHTGEHTPGGYTALNGLFEIQSNKCTVNTLTSGFTKARFDNGHSSYTWTIQFTVPTTSQDSGSRIFVPWWRHTDGNNGLFTLVHFPPGSNACTSWDVYRIVSGSLTLLLTTSSSLAAGTTYTHTLVLTPTSISITIDGVNVAGGESTFSSVTETAIQYNGTTVTTSLPNLDNNIIVP